MSGTRVSPASAAASSGAEHILQLLPRRGVRGQAGSRPALGEDAEDSA